MFFPFRLDSRYRLILKPLDVRKDDGVTVTRAPATYHDKWWKAIGIRLSPRSSVPGIISRLRSQSTTSAGLVDAITRGLAAERTGS
jgi:hypothetical protein